MRTIRNRNKEAVWFTQQARVRATVAHSFDGVRLGIADAQLRLEGDLPDRNDPAPVLLAACDERYFRQFGKQLAASCLRLSPATRVHLHLVEPSAETLAALPSVLAQYGPRLTISHEDGSRSPYPEPSKFYYTAARFAVAARLRNLISAPLLVVDVDGLVVNDMSPGFAELAPYDVGLLLRPEFGANYRKVLAGALYLGNSGAAADFANRLADAIALALESKPRFHVDQLILWFALQHARARDLKLKPLDPRWIDYEFSRESFIWTTKGARKEQFERLLRELQLETDVQES